TEHHPHNLGTEHQGTAKICPAGFVDVVRRQFPKRAFEAARRTGVIDPTVNDREFRDGVRHERLSLARRGHIARHAMQFASGHLDSKCPSAASRRLWSRPQMTTRSPASRNNLAIARPSPADPPVTTTPKG